MKPISRTNLEQAKCHNRRVVIEAIRTNGPLSRAAIARLTALTTQTVSNIVEELEVAMLLTADAAKKIPRGQPVRLYSINPDGAYSIGLDLERDLAVGVLTDLAGRVRARVERAVERPTPAEAMPVLAEIVLELQQAFPLDSARLLGAGIAMPGRYATEV
ncbi:putative ArsR family transcriptional regulator [Rhizobium sp. BK399]|nr:putative ArsR family transcriptional regulator [Rhizobium sp. BK399]